MSDPFEALRRPVEPADPDPGFAATLRARLERALALPRGVTVSTETGHAPARTAEGAAIPYLAVPVGDGRRAIDWYADVLGAGLVGEPYVMEDGRVGHAELALAGGKVYLAEEFPEIGVLAPQRGVSSVSLVLTVPDVEETVAVAVRAGGELTRPPYEEYGSRNATVVDPFGHRWLLQTPLAAQLVGGVGYVWLTVPDVDRAVAFWGPVLGWTFVAAHGRGRMVEGRQIGIDGRPGEAAFHASYGVPDIVAAVERVRAAGGRPGDVMRQPWGAAARCADDQGTEFALHETQSPAQSRVEGLSYVTVEVPDSARARAFYGSVLGWRFAPGRVEDGWSVEGVEPMTGLHGGGARAAIVPMWRVEDVAAAVERVRAAGGTATGPERRPYGITSECTDDQGTPFYLGDAGSRTAPSG